MHKKLLYFFLTLILASEFIFGQVISDLIPTISLTQGEEKEIVVSDLFYSDNYDIIFDSNDDLEVEYNKDNRILKLKSGNSYGYYLLDFNLDSLKYSIPVS